jgi:aerobic-type carbon monoxide dehydrogenase small subunit (CoxS/CutS family)
MRKVKKKMEKVLGVRIYPGRVLIDGSTIPTADLADTLKEVYPGFKFEVVFTCGFCTPGEVKEARTAFGTSLI